MLFKDNISPSIDRFLQRRTYYGVLEGVPDSTINKDNIEYAKGEALRHFGIKNIYVITPTEKKWLRTNGEEKAELPHITCMAELTHYEPMKDASKECSKLCLIWFQNEYAFPIAEEILQKINELEWKICSEDKYL